MNKYQNRNPHSTKIDIISEIVASKNLHSHFTSIAAHLKKALEKSKIEIKDLTENTLGRQKHLASEVQIQFKFAKILNLHSVP